MAIWQLRFSPRKRSPLFPTEEKRRVAIRRLARVGGESLALFGFVYEHGHPLVICDEVKVGSLRRSLRISLGSVAGVALEPIWHDPVEGKNHARALVKYLLTQVEHHNLAAHPALWSGSSFQDIVGARHVAGLRPRLEELVPDLTVAEIHQWVGLPPQPIQPARNDLIRSLGAVRLKAAAAAALAAEPTLEGRSGPVMSAKRTVAHLARQAEITTRDVSRCLHIVRQNVSRLARGDANPRWLEATRVRLALEQVVLKEADLAVFAAMVPATHRRR